MPPAPFQAIRDRAVAAVDRVMAEPVKLSFMAKGVVDPERPARDVEAVLRTGDGKASAATPGVSGSWRGRISAQKAELHLDRAKYPGLVVRAGDRVRAVSRDGQPWWEVLGIDPRGFSRLVLHLGEL